VCNIIIEIIPELVSQTLKHDHKLYMFITKNNCKYISKLNLNHYKEGMETEDEGFNLKSLVTEINKHQYMDHNILVDLG
jgi:hypothetical protein